jgi:tryptophan halogenase
MKLIIVGGGTAGWITALMACKRFPDLDITVIESSEIGIIGVGESTTGEFTKFISNFWHDFGCDHDEFMKETGATIKYGILHKNWKGNNDSYFAPIDGSYTSNLIPDAFLAHLVTNNLKPLYPTASRLGYLYENNKINYSKTKNQFSIRSHAMHIDGNKTSAYLKKIACKNKNVKVVDGKVADVTFNSLGFIQNLILSDNRIIEGDFFIDCSGFSKVLISKFKTPWYSYRQNLPLNSALPFQTKYKDKECPEPFTTAWAQDSGWMWTTPLADRKGNGYVFFDLCSSPDQAQKEIEDKLNQKIDPIKLLKFEAGRFKNSWNKNCLAIGFSFCFLEPLEATAIHSIIIQAYTFIFEYLKISLVETVNEGSINFYNKRINHLYDAFRDFIVLHYLGKRSDTVFWNFYKNECVIPERVKHLIEMSSCRFPTMYDFEILNGTVGWPLYSYILTGLDLIPKSVARDSLEVTMPTGINLKDAAREEYIRMQDMWKAESQDFYTCEEFYKIFYRK